MTFSSAVRPRIKLNCWKMKPKVRRRTSVRKRSGKLEMTSPSMLMRPDVGRAMQPTRLKRVVFPDPLGPVNAVAMRLSRASVTPRKAGNSFGWPALYSFVTSRSSIIQVLMTRSGSTVAARHVGSTVAARYGNTTRKKSVATW